jgi:hypothetical protein
MKAFSYAPSLRLVLLAAVFGISGALDQIPAADPNLNLAISGTSQSAVLTWFADSGVAYQLESSPDLVTWSNFGPVRIGAGDFINVTQSIIGQTQGFFRLKRVFIIAVFDPGTGTLTITSDDNDNIIVVSRDAAGNIRVNNGAVSIQGGTATVANTSVIQISGGGGNDQLSLDESNGALPRANLFGEGGNDTLTGGDADDQIFGEADNDRIIWNPGDDTDLNEGGSGIDTVEINGGNGDEQFTTTANGTRVRFDRINPAPFSIDIGTSENLVVNMNGGNDSFSATGNLAALISITVDGGVGQDTILGGNGADTLLGGDGNDFIDGNQGNDTILLGAADDIFQWDPGDGNDIVEGQDGVDTMIFNGSAIAETFDVSANGGRVRFTRNIGTITMDLNDVETINLNALGGADSLTVNDLTGTDLTNVNVDLASTLGGSTGDGAVDLVTVNGSAAADAFSLVANAGAVQLTGLTALVQITHSELALDSLVINGLGGVDTFSIGPGVTTLINVTTNQ